MKTKNFPARKLARQISADMRLNSGYSVPAQLLHSQDVDKGGAMTSARAVRTKKRRSATGSK